MPVQEIAKAIGADSLGYLSVAGVNQIAEGARCGFCDGCFTGCYPVDVPQVVQKNKFERKLSEAKEEK